MRTKIAIAQGTLGRRIMVERLKLEGMEKAADYRGLSYQHGLMIGLLIAKQIMETLSEAEVEDGCK